MATKKSDIQVEIEKQSKLLPAQYVSVRKAAPYDGAPNEVVFQSDLNNTIILGGSPQNRPEVAKSTYTSTITLVSGMGTAIKNSPPPLDAGKLTLSPKHYYDSAVLQICEQTDDIDSNFGARIQDEKARNRSAIALKADEVRLFSRGSVKIITGIDRADKPTPDPKAPSHPNSDLEFNGIHLIANNSANNLGDLQPLVLGTNLEEFLNKVLNEINNIYALIEKVCDKQSIINDAVKQHTHLSNFIPEALLPLTDPNMVQKITLNDGEIKQIVNINNSTTRIPNIENLRKNYLIKNPVFYINSYYNKTN